MGKGEGGDVGAQIIMIPFPACHPCSSGHFVVILWSFYGHFEVRAVDHLVRFVIESWKGSAVTQAPDIPQYRCH